MKRKILILLSCLGFQMAVAQEAQHNKELFTEVSNHVGMLNLSPFNGPKFTDLFNSSKDNHRFFKENRYRQSSIQYNTHNYYTIQIKYDLITDEVIAVGNDNLGFFDFVMIKANISTFELSGSHFDKFSFTDKGESYSGFFERIDFKNDYSLLVKHIKLAKENYSSNALAYTFIESELFFIKHREKIYVINKYKDLLRAFEDDPSMIEQLKNLKRSSFKENPRIFLSKLLSNA